MAELFAEGEKKDKTAQEQVKVGDISHTGRIDNEVFQLVVPELDNKVKTMDEKTQAYWNNHKSELLDAIQNKDEKKFSNAIKDFTPPSVTKNMYVIMSFAHTEAREWAKNLASKSSVKSIIAKKEGRFEEAKKEKKRATELTQGMPIEDKKEVVSKTNTGLQERGYSPKEAAGATARFFKDIGFTSAAILGGLMDSGAEDDMANKAVAEAIQQSVFELSQDRFQRMKEEQDKRTEEEFEKSLEEYKGEMIPLVGEEGAVESKKVMKKYVKEGKGEKELTERIRKVVLDSMKRIQNRNKINNIPKKKVE